MGKTIKTAPARRTANANLIQLPPVTLRLTTGMMREVAYKITMSPAYWPANVNKEWEALRKQDAILADVVIDGLINTLSVADLNRIVYDVTRVLPSHFNEVYEWLIDNEDAPPKTMMVAIKANPPAKLQFIREFAVSKVKQKLAELKAAESGEPAPKVVNIKTAKSATERDYSNFPARQAPVSATEVVVGVTPLRAEYLAIKAEMKNSGLTEQAVVGRVNRIVMAAVAGLVEKAKSSPKRFLQGDEMQTQFFSAPKQGAANRIDRTLKAIFGGDYAGLLDSPKGRSFTVVFVANKYPTQQVAKAK